MAGKKKNSSKALPQDPFEDMGTMDWLDPESEDAARDDSFGTAALTNASDNTAADAIVTGETPPTSEVKAEMAAEGVSMPESNCDTAMEAKALESSGNDKIATQPVNDKSKSKKKKAAKRTAKPEESAQVPELTSGETSEITEAAAAANTDEHMEIVGTKELKRSGVDGAESRSKKRKPKAKKPASTEDAEKPEKQPESAKVTDEIIAEHDVDPGIEAPEAATEVIDPYLENLIAKIDDEMEGAFGWDPIVEESPEDTGDTTAEQYIIFELAGTEYAVYITNVIEIGPPLQVTPVPNVPVWIDGVVNLRGDIVSVVDLRSFLGMQPTSYRHSSRMLVARTHHEDLTVGLIVDRVSGIRFLEVDRFGAPTADIEDQIAPYLRGTYEHDGHLLVVLDLDRLLRSAEMRQFESV